ncbi:hypothetical protein RIEPE_0081 [Candidatus Riesia pediculicola USDA]|uniref:Uncharacterized protein n=1 Tax=Riesia pediculicola (strain USDA) TaxID=515618 RepID=D4G7P2_RIEPU|nr:hypothetical protein RIEPE_0081 [Candidatus Riesia pediculicola USDA]
MEKYIYYFFVSLFYPPISIFKCSRKSKKKDRYEEIDCLLLQKKESI